MLTDPRSMQQLAGAIHAVASAVEAEDRLGEAMAHGDRLGQALARWELKVAIQRINDLYGHMAVPAWQWVTGAIDELAQRR